VNSFYEESKLVNAYDVDLNNKLKLNSLFNYLQETASNQADKLNLGFNDLIVQDLGWVLSWAKVEISSFPGFGETIRVKTWPKCRYKLFSMRDFIVTGDKDNTFFKVSTAWLMINVKTKRITDIRNLIQQIYYRPDQIALNDFPEKLINSKERNVLFTKKIRYTDLDINQHVNNTKYIELVLDSFSPEYHKSHNLQSLTISFNSESFYDDELEIRSSSDNQSDNRRFIDGINIKTSKQVFQALVHWNS
jgi:acyl-ACP thioesterase